MFYRVIGVLLVKNKNEEFRSVAPDEVWEHLEEVLSSDGFRSSERLQNFLTFIVEETLQGRGADLKAYRIAVEAFDYPEDFDPSVNPIVRVEAGRLRSKLDRFYLTNPDVPMVISIPTGGYAVRFTRRDQAYPSAPATRHSLPKRNKSVHLHNKTPLLIKPFSSISKSELMERFLTGLVNEISTGLTRFPELAVLGCSMNACSGMSDMAVCPLPEARFVLSGSAAMDGDNLKVWVNLMDVSDGVNAWAERFSLKFDAATLSDIEENIAECITSRIADDFGLLHRTWLKETMTGNSEGSKYRETVLLYHQWGSILSLESYRQVLAGMEDLVVAEPDDMRALAMLADLYASNHQWSYGVLENSLERSLEMARRAVNLDPACQVAHLAMAMNYYLRQDWNLFEPSAQKAISLNPCNFGTLSILASWYALFQKWDKSLELMKKSMSVNPNLPGWCWSTLSLYYYMHGDYENAYAEAKKIMMPGCLWDGMFRIISGVKLGLEEDVRRGRQDLLKIYPDFNTEGRTIVANNIGNKELVAVICAGLEEGGITLG